MFKSWSPVHFVMGLLYYRRAWLRWHQWQPNCRLLWKNLKRLNRE